MQFVGIDLHTNRFTCCYRDGNVTGDGDKRIETFSLDKLGIADFIGSLTPETYVLVEATMGSFSFVRIIEPHVKKVIVANTYELKQISLGRNKTDKIDADKLCRIIKMQVLSGEQTVSPVTVPPVKIQDLRSLFTTYRLYKKQTVQLKNRIHSILKENLYGFTREEIFSQKRRKDIRELVSERDISFQINDILDTLEFLEGKIQKLEDEILVRAEDYMSEIEILTSMKGISVFIAIAIISDIICVSRFKNSKHFTSYLRSALKVQNSNTSVSHRGTNKKGRKLSATLLTQVLLHVLSASPKLNNWYERLKQYKKAGLVRTGLRRRVFAEIFQMLKKKEFHYGREAGNHERKMTAYKKFLEKRKNLLKAA